MKGDAVELAGAAAPGRRWLGDRSAWRWFAGLSLSFAAVTAGLALWNGSSRDAWPLVLAAASTVTVWPLSRSLKPNPVWFWTALASLGVAVGAWALWQKAVGAVGRVDIPDLANAIVFGDLSLLIGLLCLAGMGWAWRTPLGWWRPVVLLGGASGGLLAAALSVTRNVWVVLPVGLLVLYLGHVRYARTHFQVLMGLAVAAFMGVVFLLPQTGVADRMVRSMRDIEHIWAKDGSPAGCSRLDLYSVVLRDVIPERLFLGHGDDRLHSRLQALAAEGQVTENLAHNKNIRHAHNEALDTMVRRGLVGLVILLALYAVPLAWFATRLRVTDPALRSVALAGTLVPVTYIGFGLTYTMFAYPMGIALYLGLLGILWGLWSNGLRSLASYSA